MPSRSLLAANTVLEGRTSVEAVLCGDDDRLIVVVGCATHFELTVPNEL